MPLLGSVRRVVDRGGWVVRHVGDMHHSAVNRGCRGRAKILFISLPFTHVVAGVNVDIAHAGKDQAIVSKLDVRRAQMRPDLDNPLAFDADLPRHHAFGTDEAAGDDHFFLSEHRFDTSPSKAVRQGLPANVLSRASGAFRRRPAKVPMPVPPPYCSTAR